jgi:hypothetical protein
VERVVAEPRLEAELANAAAAMSWVAASGPAETAARMAIAWGRYWYHANRRSDGIRWADAALEREVAPGLRAELQLTRAALVGARELERFRADLEPALEYFRAAGDARHAAECLGHLAFGCAWAAEYEQARALADDALRFAEEVPDVRVLARALTHAAMVGERFDEIAEDARVAIPLLRELGHLGEIGRLCSLAGFIAISERREREALPWLEEGLAAAREATGAIRLSLVLGNVGLAHLFLGDLDAAEAAFGESLALMMWSGEEQLVDETLLGMSAVSARRGELERAAQLEGAATARPLGSRNVEESEVWGRLMHEILDPVRGRLGPVVWESAARRGAALGLRELLDLALHRESVAAA